MEFRINSDLKRIKEASLKILAGLEKKQLDQGFLFDLKLACEEAMINAVKYGNKSNKDKTVSISCDIRDDAVVVSVEDEGNGFDYRALPDPTSGENITKTRGRGIFLIRQLMDKVEFNSPGNRITMTKFFK
ncbi:MAG: ATP-binding protein [Candidatus Omnitrophica bacterium]|nr:ATP-binding protein [Candidatus Omnitrophota bacterium]